MTSSIHTPIAIIVAISRNGVIGRDNAMPWHLPGEQKYFKACTLGKPVVMGRKTYESIGRPLPERPNIVVTRDENFRREGVRVVRSLDTALQLADGIARRDGAAEIMVIGGGDIYTQTLPLAQHLYLTLVHADIDGDAYFPEWDESEWETERREEVAASAEAPAYSLILYRRKAGGR